MLVKVPSVVVLLSLLLEGCVRSPVHEPATLTFLEEWTNKTFSDARQQELQQFTRETGIRVELLPSPESAGDDAPHEFSRLFEDQALRRGVGHLHASQRCPRGDRPMLARGDWCGCFHM